MSQLPELMTGRQFADVLGVDPKTVDRWRKDRKIASVPLPNGRFRYFRAEADAWRRGQPLTPQQIRELREGVA